MTTRPPRLLFALLSLACLSGCPGGGGSGSSGRLDRFYPTAPATAETEWITIGELEKQGKVLFGAGGARVMRAQLGIPDPYDLELRADLDYDEALKACLGELGDAESGLRKTLEAYHRGMIDAGTSPTLERGEPVPEAPPGKLVSMIQANNVRYLITIPVDETSELAAAHARLEQAKADGKAFFAAVSRPPSDGDGDDGDEE